MPAAWLKIAIYTPFSTGSSAVSIQSSMPVINDYGSALCDCTSLSCSRTPRFGRCARSGRIRMHTQSERSLFRMLQVSEIDTNAALVLSRQQRGCGFAEGRARESRCRRVQVDTIECVVSIQSDTEVHALGNCKALADGKVDFREPRSAEGIPSQRAVGPGRWKRSPWPRVTALLAMCLSRMNIRSMKEP